PNDLSGEPSKFGGDGCRLAPMVGASSCRTWLSPWLMSSAPSRAHWAHRPLGQYAGNSVPHSAQRLVSGICSLFSRNHLVETVARSHPRYLFSRIDGAGFGVPA